MEIIHPNQTGFLPHRYIRNNLQVIFNILEYYEAHPGKQVALIFFDSEKAFNNIKWEFILEQIKRMAREENFLKMIQAIYRKQKAKIGINGDSTEEFSITKGTHQEFPLSPLLYILVLEVLNNSIRENMEMIGIKVRN